VVTVEVVKLLEVLLLDGVVQADQVVAVEEMFLEELQAVLVHQDKVIMVVQVQTLLQDQQVVVEVLVLPVVMVVVQLQVLGVQVLHLL
jgi:hypothetical protein